ncbi:MAG TPA: dihydroorotate dehydrogenase-like protein [Bacteroidales bacterium]|nr:dihydroorotate dehydrogenase-like protein [Bacteroidales bacterium]HSA42790.1 dihydroorotate dehydrogenase-like protein [Bacteroidales bacterium]
MPDLSTTFMGIRLRNPVIAGSSGLTSRPESIIELARHGVAAVVLKSLFEEDMALQARQHVTHPATRMDDYLRLIETAKQRLDIPVIASVNCISPHEWTGFSRKIVSAGADGLEMNMFVPPSDPMKNSEENEKLYFEIITEVRRQVKIPLAVKISPYFSGMTKMALKLSWTGINGLVMFNRFYSPDIDIEEIRVVPGRIFSTPDEIAHPLRWVAMLSDRVMCDTAGSTGVHDYTGIVRFLLAGAKAVQIVSAYYENGPSYTEKLLEGLTAWMERHNFDNINAFMGKLSLKKTENPAEYERFQFLKTFSSIE